MIYSIDETKYIPSKNEINIDNYNKEINIYDIFLLLVVITYIAFSFYFNFKINIT